MPQDPGPQFRRTFTDDVRRVLTDALRRAYDTACEFYDEDRGSSAVVFGFSLFHYACFELQQKALRREADFRWDSHGGISRLIAGEYRLACHNVGRTERDDIWKSFPNGGGGVAMMASSLPLFEREEVVEHVEPLDVSTSRNIFLVHMGNKDDGLCAVYLCIPAKMNMQEIDGKLSAEITEWAYTEKVWSRADDGFLVQPTADVLPAAPTGSGAQPPAEDIEDPQLRRRQKPTDTGTSDK